MLLVIRSHMDEVDKTGWSNGPYGFGSSTPATGGSSSIYGRNASSSRSTYSPVTPPKSSAATPVTSVPVSMQPKSKSPVRSHAGYEYDPYDTENSRDRRDPRSVNYRDPTNANYRSPTRVVDTNNGYTAAARDTGSYRSPVRVTDTNKRYSAAQDTGGYRSPTRRQASPLRRELDDRTNPAQPNPVSRKVSFNVNDANGDLSSSDDQYARRR